MIPSKLLSVVKGVALLALVAILSGPANAEPTYVVTGGKLTEIDSIFIDAALGTWDVKFVDGTLFSIFGFLPVFDFNNYADANSAATALLNSLVDGKGGLNVDSNPGDMFGCEGDAPCNIVTPYQFPYYSAGGDLFMLIRLVDNSYIESEDEVDPIGISSGFLDDTTPIVNYVYADWSPSSSSTSPVSAPGTLMLLLAAMFAAAATRFCRLAVRRSLPFSAAVN